jgi:uncharacterized protein YcbX
VARLNVAPVKGTALAHPERVTIERDGVAENRRFHLVNARGRLFSGTRHGPLVSIRASYDRESEWLELRFPDGVVVSGRADVLGEPLTTVMWSREVPGHVVDGPWSEAMSAFVAEPVRLIRSEEPGQGNDSHAVSMVSLASVRELSARSGLDQPLDSRRFRMLVEIDGHEEDRWVGCLVRIGGAVVRVVRPDPRCVVTEQNPDTGVRDFDTRKAILAYRPSFDGDANMGVYADVVEPGPVAAGDLVSVLPT